MMGGFHNSHSTAQEQRVEMGMKSYEKNCNILGILEHHRRGRSAQNLGFKSSYSFLNTVIEKKIAALSTPEGRLKLFLVR